MKFSTALIGICLTMIFAATTWAQNGPGYKNGKQNSNPNCPLCTSSAPSQELNDAEISWLLYMREEEKLAQDVYVAFYDMWGLRIFKNISASETRHFDALGTLLVRYELQDPAQSGAGIFSNPDIQSLYDALIAEGALSVADALEVGVKIEEKDIEDLVEAMNVTNNKDIQRVYANLLNGSYNHLDSFSTVLEIVN
jgi:hypothetical protein